MKYTIKFSGIEKNTGRHWMGVYSRPARGERAAWISAFQDIKSLNAYSHFEIMTVSWHVDDQGDHLLQGGDKTRDGKIPAVCVDDGSDQLHIFESGEYIGASDLTASELAELKFSIRNMC